MQTLLSHREPQAVAAHQLEACPVHATGVICAELVGSLLRDLQEKVVVQDLGFRASDVITLSPKLYGFRVGHQGWLATLTLHTSRSSRAGSRVVFFFVG